MLFTLLTAQALGWEPQRSRRWAYVEWLIRLSLILIAFLGALLGNADVAEAKSPMCSDAAESIAAPPPLMVHHETLAHGCEVDDDFDWVAVPHSNPTPHLGSLIDSSQQFALLPERLSFPDRCQLSSWPLADEERLNMREHRSTLVRPPSDCRSAR